MRPAKALVERSSMGRERLARWQMGRWVRGGWPHACACALRACVAGEVLSVISMNTFDEL